MSLISGMDEVIAYIKEQDETIKNLKTNETIREELIVEMKSEIKSLHKKLDLANGSNNPLNLKDKGFGFHSSGSPRSKPYHELLSQSFKKLKEENEKLMKENKKLKKEHKHFDGIWKTEGITEQEIIDMKRKIEE